jgi:hypothetical protein
MQKRLIVLGAAVAALLVVAAGAGAVGRFVITSTSQIKPSVLRALHANQTARGLRGATGAKVPLARRGLRECQVRQDRPDRPATQA